MSLDGADETTVLFSSLTENGNSSTVKMRAALYAKQNTYLHSICNLRPLICRPQRLWHRMMLCRFSRKISWRYLVLSLFILVIIFTLYIGVLSNSSSHIFNSLTKNQPPISVFQCSNKANFLPHEHLPFSGNASALEGKLREEPKVLLFTETQYSRHGKAIAELLVANRIKYKMEVLGKSLPLLTDLSRGKYGAIIFENIERYLAMDQWNRELLDKYLLEYRVGIVGFFPQYGPSNTYAKLHNFPLYVTSSNSLHNITLNGNNPVLRLTRAGDSLPGILDGSNWTLFIPDHPTYIPIEWANDTTKADGGTSIFAILDSGKLDNIHRVLLGGGLQFWLHRLLLIDALSYLSGGRLSVSLERYILIDVDDIFVGPKGNRMVPSDVEAMIDAQEKLQHFIPDFKFNLGFSGKFFQRGSSLEAEGDVELLKHIDKFSWFGHMWGHTQPHKVGTTEQLESVMLKNKEFAKRYGIPTDSRYSVAPHHSGVYPVHEPLYEAWKKVWNIRVTSSEEYPHLRPSRLRRGFIHKNIMVLPRQTCGLYTHTNYLDMYPGGREVLDRSIYGGELFQTIVYNPINIFMTHQNNYAHDRLAIYAFEAVVKFIKCWTNLKLLSAPPQQLGEKYFQMFPNEVEPVWGNPCLDNRHYDIWSVNKTCDQLPQFLVIGPQKTGTTALYSFLAMHPVIVPNNPSLETFEEVQFFNGRNYLKGIDWYMKFFDNTKNYSSTYFFEKSATYFDGELVPKRVQALLPKAQLVTIIIPPEKRAYSWYHHMRAHGDPTSMFYSFYQVITATSKSPKSLRDLKNKCLNPGTYAKHLERWLTFFQSSQISIIDGEQLRNNPVEVMNNLQKFLNISPFFNYTEHLRFDKRKGFYCQVTEEDKTKCLGRGKGRLYPPMQVREEKILKDFYKEHNIALEKLLSRLSYPVPSWLYQELVGT